MTSQYDSFRLLDEGAEMTAEEAVEHWHKLMELLKDFQISPWIANAPTWEELEKEGKRWKIK